MGLKLSTKQSKVKGKAYNCYIKGSNVERIEDILKDNNMGISELFNQLIGYALDNIEG